MAGGPYSKLDQNQIIQRVFDEDNDRLKVDAAISATIGTVECIIDSASGDNISIKDSDGHELEINADGSINVVFTPSDEGTKITDGTDTLEINSDGSINTINDIAPDELPQFPYDEITAVASGIETQIISYTVPVGQVGLIYRAECSGDNIAHYKVYVNGSPIASRRTYFGSELNADFDFTSPNKRSVVLIAGDVLSVKVLHNRPSPGNFEGRLILLETPA